MSHLLKKWKFGKVSVCLDADKKIITIKVAIKTGADPPPASLGTSPGSAPTLLVESPVITRIFSFSADLLAEFWTNTGNTFPANFAMDLGSQVR